MRKSQLTAFMLAGLLLLVVLGIGLMLAFSVTRDGSGVGSQVDEYVVSCLKLVAEQGMDRLGRNGGLINPLQCEEQSFGKACYWLKDGNASVPAVESGMLELGSYIEDNLGVCLAGISDMEGISMDVPDVECIASSKQVHVSLSLPIAVVSDAESSRRSRFDVMIPVRYAKIHGFAEGIVRMKRELPQSFDIGELVSEDLDVHILTYPGHHVIVVTDHASRVENRPYRLVFSVTRHKQ